jgi:hypothetical protein
VEIIECSVLLLFTQKNSPSALPSADPEIAFAT